MLERIRPICAVRFSVVSTITGAPAVKLCQLCNEPCEYQDQPEGAELCNACATYLDARFGPVVDDLTDTALDSAFMGALEKDD